MNNLIINKPTLDSREIANMLETNHDQILRKLEGAKDRKGVIKILNDNQMVVVDYFIKSSYIDSKGEERPCYLFTKMGCEFIANKFTGEKGILFTAKYVKRFNQMEGYINNNKLVNSFKAEVTTLIDDIVSQKIIEIEEKCSDYYRPSSAEKQNISQYIKKRLGISKADEYYELVKQRVLIKLGATKWEDIPIETLRDSLNIIDESIRVIKADRTTNQISLFEVACN